MTLFSDDPKISTPLWLVENQLLWTKKIEGGKTEFWVGSAGSGEKKYSNPFLESEILMGVVHI